MGEVPNVMPTRKQAYVKMWSQAIYLLKFHRSTTRQINDMPKVKGPELVSKLYSIHSTPNTHGGHCIEFPNNGVSVPSTMQSSLS